MVPDEEFSSMPAQQRPFAMHKRRRLYGAPPPRRCEDDGVRDGINMPPGIQHGRCCGKVRSGTINRSALSSDAGSASLRNEQIDSVADVFYSAEFDPCAAMSLGYQFGFVFLLNDMR
jgi:hypothetical protein